MLKRTLALGACLTATLAVVGCQEQLTSPAPAPVTARASTAELERQSSLLETVSLTRGPLVLPPSARMSDHGFADFAGRAINPSDYVCSPSSPVIDWYSAEVNRVFAQERAIFLTLYFALADLIPTYDALLIQTTATPQYFGYNGEYTKTMVKAERDVKGFWDIASNDIQVIGMHGSMLLDLDRTAATYRFVFGLSPARAMTFATAVKNALLQSQLLNGGNHPFFSFNAFAFTAPGSPFPDKIVMGDGILAGYESLGFGDVAPQAIFAHEFGHHIQFENGYFDDLDPLVFNAAERTRYTELMADAMSAYYLTHKRGATMNQKRVAQFLEVFFQIGDCSFTSGGHHGTPNQRMKAAQFGFRVADEAQKQGHILTSAQFHARFVAQYSTLIAPDAF